MQHLAAEMAKDQRCTLGFRAAVRSDQYSQPRAVDILDVVHFQGDLLPSAIRPFNFSRRALLSSPSTMPPSSATTDTPSTSRSVIFNARFVSFLNAPTKNLSGATRSDTTLSVPFGISECSFLDCLTSGFIAPYPNENDRHDAQTVVRRPMFYVRGRCRERCVLHSGALRAEPHVDRRLTAAEAVEMKRSTNRYTPRKSKLEFS